MLDRAIFFSRLAMAESGFWARGGRLGTALGFFLRGLSSPHFRAPAAAGHWLLRVAFFWDVAVRKNQQLKVERGFPGWLMGQNFWFLY